MTITTRELERSSSVPDGQSERSSVVLYTTEGAALAAAVARGDWFYTWRGEIIVIRSAA